MYYLIRFLIACIGCLFGVLAMHLGYQASDQKSRWLRNASFICWFIFIVVLIWCIFYVIPELMYEKGILIEKQ